MLANDSPLIGRGFVVGHSGACTWSDRPQKNDREFSVVIVCLNQERQAGFEPGNCVADRYLHPQPLEGAERVTGLVAMLGK